MRNILVIALLALGFIFTAATSAPPAADGGDTTRKDAGDTSDCDPACGEGYTCQDGSCVANGVRCEPACQTGYTCQEGTCVQDTPQGWQASMFGAACTVATEATTCSSEGACGNLFTSGDSSCWKKCETTADCTDFPYNASAVICDIFWTNGPRVCGLASPELGPCGNAVNAGCAGPDPVVCALDPSGFGACIRICTMPNPQDNTVCGTEYQTVCGCDPGEGCSMDMPVSTAPGTDPFGICAPASTAGDTCGLNMSTLSLMPCTGEQLCVGASESNPTGTCTVNTTGDAGTSTGDAGTGPDA